MNYVFTTTVMAIELINAYLLALGMQMTQCLIPKEPFKLIAPVKKGDFTGGNNECPTLTSQQLYIKCSITNLKFLIDTGSSCSVIPVDHNSRDHPQDYLSAVNGNSVPTFGCKNITILTWEVLCL